MSNYLVAVLWAVFLPAASCLYVIQSPESIIVHEGESTVITCNFDNGMRQSAASVKLYRLPDEKNPINVSSDGRIIFHSTDTTLTMTISNAIFCDSGTYVCIVQPFNERPYKGIGTTLQVIASTTTQERSQYVLQTVADITRIILLLILIVLLIILIWRFW